MRRNEILLDLARMLENCNNQDLSCECVYNCCSMCVNTLACKAIASVQRLLDKPEIRSCRIPLVIDFERMTDLNYWLTSNLFGTPFKERSEPLRQKIVQLVDMLNALQIKVLQVDADYAEQFFKRMAARLKKSTHNLEYELWRLRHPSPTMEQLRQKQTQITANVLIAGVLSYDDDPSGSEIRAVRRDLVENDLHYNKKLPDDFTAECAKLRRYSYWQGKHLFMIDYHKIFVYLYSHCFEELTMEQFMVLYEYDVQLKMIHEDMVRLMPELKDYEEQIPHEKASDEKLLSFIHPAIGDEEGMLIHEEVKRLVKRQSVQMICEYLLQMARGKKVLLPPNPSTAYTELVRLGMPTGKGYSEKHFRNHYLSK